MTKKKAKKTAKKKTAKKKTTARSTKKAISKVKGCEVVVGRIFGKSKKLRVPEESSIDSALAKAGLRKADNEAIQDINGNVYEGHETVEPKTAYYLIHKVKSGN